MRKRLLLILSVISLAVVYGVTLATSEHVRSVELSGLETSKEGDWSQFCGTVKKIDVREQVTFIGLQETEVGILVFKNNYEDIHVNDMREGDVLCVVGTLEMQKEGKIFIARRLGAMNG